MLLSIVRLGSVPNKNSMTAGVAVAYVAMLASLFLGRRCMPLFSALRVDYRAARSLVWARRVSRTYG